MVLMFVENQMLPIMERKVITLYGTSVPHGYNIMPGGYISPRLVPILAIKLQGRKLSEETRHRMSLAQRGKKLSREHVEKIAAANL